MFNKMNLSSSLSLAERLSVSTRLTMAFGMMIVMMVVGAAMGLGGLDGMQRTIEVQSNKRMPSLILAARWEAGVLQTARRMRNVLIMVEPDQIKSELAAIRADQQARASMVQDLGKLVASDSARASLQNIVAAAQGYSGAEDEFLKQAAAGNFDGARRELLDRVGPAEGAYIQAIGKFAGSVADEARESTTEAAASYESSRSRMLILSLLAIAIAAVVAYLFSRRLRIQLGGEPSYAALVAKSIASGDLAVRVDVRPGDNRSLIYAMSEMADSLRRLVGEVASAARVVADTSEQIAQGNIDLSQRTEEQAATLEETASSMEELTSTVMQNAESAKQANQHATGASEVARKGGHAVGEVVSTMTAISDSSRKIADIIAVIDSIAFQTNILALNAAVEAARAGEQGRGFAVVAAEVRNLAQRSAAAAKEIKGLISDSVDKVDAGTRLVDAAGKTMNEIVGSVKGVTDLIAEIAAASQEQSSGIEQVNRAVTQMEQVVQQNASLVEEATAATESMKEQAGALLQTVAHFKLGVEQRGPHESVRAGEPRAAPPVAARRAPRARPERAAQLPGASVAALGAPQPAGQGGGEWQEF
jgi:methyl-accepting chemotaxis protein